ncbi:MAG: HK97 gp10 family phage protein [Ktedonobacteraceae bacterium]|nr:HK97 gp10 family phage protein [Ktedonobacteraceae bacterium]
MQILGLAETLQAIDEYVSELEQEVDREIQQAGQEMRQEARQRAHVITGEMRDSVTYTAGHLEATVTSDVKQALFEEFGTRYRPPHTWFFPSFELTRSRLQERMRGL